MNNVNEGALYLVSLAKQVTNGSAVHLAALKALGEAGGPAAQDYLVSLAKQLTNGSALHLATIEALGKASRN
ncbi:MULTISPECIES: hypothetical protein [Pseudomonas]|uniref:hypothetical protein n=1 Tax=Pseudomonas TaxID=286 RepID=UPI0007098C6B|nr:MULTISPECIES: hypothetical protein [Pseudomonas]KQW11945.1 hypothetical protein ASC85_11500 [Pseudomonas sp. Root401]WHS51997.1 hypothetical protein QLH64_16725 [Pseudomonas brassicacearum]